MRNRCDKYAEQKRTFARLFNVDLPKWETDNPPKNRAAKATLNKRINAAINAVKEVKEPETENSDQEN